MAMHLFWSYIVCKFIFAIIISILIFWDNNSYLHMFEYSLITVIYKTIAIIFALRLNAILLIRWKKLTNGRYFWLRSVGFSSIGEIIFYFLLSPMGVIVKNYSWSQTIIETTNFCIYRVGMTIIFAVPAVFVMTFLKSIEQRIVRKNVFFPILDLTRI